MIFRNRKYFNFFVPVLGAIITAIPIVLTQYFTDSVVALVVAVAIGFSCAYATGRMLAALWNVIHENRPRFIGIYPLSFIKSDITRRTLLTVLSPIVVLSNAVWYALPVATHLKDAIFYNGFWEANASALVTTWRKQVTISDLGMANYNSHDFQDYPQFPENDVFRIDD